METPLFSIIIPTYNAEATIAKALDSIACQSFKNYELLVMDALSTDNTPVIVKSYQDSMPLCFICEKDNGIYDAMNKGIKLAKGEWLYFMGSDDWLMNEAVLQNISAELSSDLDIVYGNTIWVPEQFDDRGERSLEMLLKIGINHQRIFYNKTLFLRYEAYKLQYEVASDFEMNIRFFCNNNIKKKYVDLPVAFYHSGGFSSTMLDEVFWADWKTILYKNFISHLPIKTIYHRLEWYCWYQLNKGNYGVAFGLFCRIWFNGFSGTFFRHSMSQLKKKIWSKPAS